MKGFKRYERYKDSGVEWIGEIPEKWEVKPLKRITCFISRGITPTYVDDSSVKVINQACIYWEKLNLDNIKYQKEDSKISKGRLYKGDLIINSTGTGTLGRAAIFNLEGSYIADTHVTIIRSDKESLNNKYLFYLLQTPKYQGYIYSALVTGATNQIELSREGLSKTSIIYPKIEEQQAIVNFLDQKTAEIDSLIADKERLIELLQEQRQAIITHAVTKGLNPNVRMKDSGIEWIGEIPEHWEVTKIKYVSRINHHALSEDCDDDFEIQYIDIGGVDSNGQIIEIKKMRFGDAPSRARRIVKDGDTIVSTVRTYLKAITWVEKADDNLICSTGFAVLSPTKLINPQYLLFLMRSTQYIDEIVSRSVGVSYPAINSRDIGKIECLLPPYKEQKYIVDYINKKGKPLTDLIDCINEQILKLKEYRQSLITAAVTGKIDVRDYYNLRSE